MVSFDSMRKNPLVNNCYYHIFNRGNNKRPVFLDTDDFHYFLDALKLFNCIESLGYSSQYRRNKKQSEGLVKVVTYCLNPNHFHLLLKQEHESGISKYMQKITTGYTMYFNKKYKSSGSLFQGKFKSILVEDDAYLYHLSAYINLNFKIHGIDDPKMYRSSMAEYVDKSSLNICDNKIIIDNFSTQEYVDFAEKSAQSTLHLRSLQADILIE
jgi:putative transposase